MSRQDEYKVYYYQNSHTKRIPVLEYIQKVPVKDKGKIAAYITFLRDCSGQLDEPYEKET